MKKTDRIKSPLILNNTFSETVKACIILGIVLVAFTFPFFFQGKHFSPADRLFSFYPWRAIAPGDFEVPSNHLRADDVTKFYPFRKNLIRNFVQDGISFWQTDHLLGTPNYPTMHRFGLLFYPPVWLFFILPFNTANSLIHILNLYIGGISMWMFLRDFNLRQIPAIASAIAFMLNGYFVVWMSAYFLPGILALLPLSLLFCRRLVRNKSVSDMLILSLIIAFQFYLGYPPGSIVFLFFWCIYCVIELFDLALDKKWKDLLDSIRLLVVSIVVAAGLAALNFIPTIIHLTSSEYMIGRANQPLQLSMPLEALIIYLFPRIWGSPTGALGNVWVGWSSACEVTAYIGIAPLLVGVYGLLRGKKQVKLATFAFFSLLSAISLAYGIWPLSNIRKLPVIAATTPTRWQFGIVLAGSILLALGLDYLSTLHLKKRRRNLTIFVLLAMGFSFLVFTIASPQIIQARFEEYPLLIQSHNFQLGLILATCILLGLYLITSWIPGNIFTILITILVVLDLFAFGFGFNPYISDQELYPSTPGIKFLQTQTALFRIAPWGDFGKMLLVNTANVYGLATITGMDHYRDTAYRAFLEPMMSKSAINHANEYGSILVNRNLEENIRFLDMLNARFIITEPFLSRFERLKLVYMGPDMWIYESPSVLPRVWGVSEMELVSNEQALIKVQSVEFDPLRTVLIEQDIELAKNETLCGPDDLVSNVIGYAQDEIIVETDFACDALLVFSERFSPGWVATVDNERTEVLRADYLLRAVAVKSGKHTVHLCYHPKETLFGLGVSLFTLIIFCGMAGFIWKRWRGAVFVSVLMPVLSIIWFGKPFSQPVQPEQRLIDVDSIAPQKLFQYEQEVRLRAGQGEMAFLGYDLDDTVYSPGENLRITLYWKSLAPLEQNYTMFVHLVDEQGRRWAQKDRPPLDGKAGTKSWQQGQIIVDILELPISNDAPFVISHLEIGMYNPKTGERVPMFDTDGNRLDSDQLVLNTYIHIQP